MKKAYTITPEKYRKNQETIGDIKYKYGYPLEAGWRLLGGDIPETIKKKADKATSENASVEKPENGLYFRNKDIYNLWLNRDTDEPITARELFNIVEAISEAIDGARSAAAWSNYDGR